MSLDISLRIDKKCLHCNEILEKDVLVYDTNITHNLNKMAMQVVLKPYTLYEYLWRPEEINITKAKDLIEPITKGLADLKSNPKFYMCYDADNGWGTYEDFIPFVEQYLEALIKYPEATVIADR
jgi:hypothetical protein